MEYREKKGSLVKKILFSLLALSLVCTLSSCSSSKDSSKVVKIAASPVPHAEILRSIQSAAKEQGINLKILEIEDYQIPNRLLAEGEVEANFFQHLPFLEEQNAHLPHPLASLVRVHIEPLGIYSKKVSNLKDLKVGAIIALPNDPTNESRALELLSHLSLITLSPHATLLATPLDIVENPKKLSFREIDAALTARMLPEVDLSIIPANYAFQVGLSPLKDALAYEGDSTSSSSSKYANIVAVRQGEENRPDLLILKKLLESSQTQKFILERYQGSLIPVLNSP